MTDSDPAADWIAKYRTDAAALQRLRAARDAEAALLASVGVRSGRDLSADAFYGLALLPARSMEAKSVAFASLTPVNAWSSEALKFLLAPPDGEARLARIVATIAAWPPGPMSLIVERLLGFDFYSFCPTWKCIEADALFESWAEAIRRTPALLLPRADFRAALMDHMRSDPDGPVERILDVLLENWIAKPPPPPRRRIWTVETRTEAANSTRTHHKGMLASLLKSILRTRSAKRHALLAMSLMEERALDGRRRRSASVVTVHRMKWVDAMPERALEWNQLVDIASDWRAGIRKLHSAKARIEDYVEELDTVAERRREGWSRFAERYDNDREAREGRVACRLAEFPDPAAVRETFETMLLNRPAVVLRDEGPTQIFSPGAGGMSPGAAWPSRIGPSPRRSTSRDFSSAMGLGNARTTRPRRASSRLASISLAVRVLQSSWPRWRSGTTMSAQRRALGWLTSPIGRRPRRSHKRPFTVLCSPPLRS